MSNFAQSHAVGGDSRMSGMGIGMKGGDAKQLILSVMKEMTKHNKMINKEDIFTTIKSKVDQKVFTYALE